MDLQLRNKVAIVTASAGGIGAEIATCLADEGMKVVVSTDRDVAGGEAVAERIRSDGGEGFFERCDVAIEDQVRQLVKATVDRYGRVDVLVNNAGIQRFRPVEDLDRDEWDAIIAVNLTGPALTAKHVVPVMKQTMGGSIINISSIHDVVTAPLMGAYPATKSALSSLSRVLALELGPHGIRVNSVLPGYIETPMFLGDATRRGGGDAQVFIDQLNPSIPVRRIGQPTDVARVVAFLASPVSSYVTGASLLVDGGVSVQL